MEKNISRKNIFKDAGVLLVLTMLVLTTAVVAVPTLVFRQAHDVGVTEIISPTNGPMQTYPVEVRIKNYGQYSEYTDVQVIIKKGELAEYADLQEDISTDPGESLTVEFADWNPSGLGEYEVTACTQLDGDENTSNDCLTKTFYITTEFQGFEVAPLGQATLEIVNDNLTVSNMGSSGNDGVWINLEDQGNWFGYNMTNPDPTGSLPIGATITSVYSCQINNEECSMRDTDLKEPDGGGGGDYWGDVIRPGDIEDFPFIFENKWAFLQWAMKYYNVSEVLIPTGENYTLPGIVFNPTGDYYWWTAHWMPAVDWENPFVYHPKYFYVKDRHPSTIFEVENITINITHLSLDVTYTGFIQGTQSYVDIENVTVNLTYAAVYTKNISTITFIELTTGLNNPPANPSIIGTPIGKIGKEYKYKLTATDPDGDNVYFIVDWDDGSNLSCNGPYASGATATVSHSWAKKGTYNIRVKAMDPNYFKSDWKTFKVIMPKNKAINTPLLNYIQYFLSSHPNMFPILRYLLGL